MGREFKNETTAERVLRQWTSDYEAGRVAARSDMKLGDWPDKRLSNQGKEGVAVAGYETKIRLHVKPHIGGVKLCDVTDDTLGDPYRLLESAPVPDGQGVGLGGEERPVRNAKDPRSTGVFAGVRGGT